MATNKPATQTFTVTGTINNLQVGVELKATDIASAVEEAKKLKFSDFITAEGNVHDFEGPEITSVWKN